MPSPAGAPRLAPAPPMSAKSPPTASRAASIRRSPASSASPSFPRTSSSTCSSPASPRWDGWSALPPPKRPATSSPNGACGVVQSEGPERVGPHRRLACTTRVGWLERAPTCREAREQLAEKGVDNDAFLGCPVLQASDILLYKGSVVPVGEDQLPHL